MHCKVFDDITVFLGCKLNPGFCEKYMELDKNLVKVGHAFLSQLNRNQKGVHSLHRLSVG